MIVNDINTRLTGDASDLERALRLVVGGLQQYTKAIEEANRRAAASSRSASDTALTATERMARAAEEAARRQAKAQEEAARRQIAAAAGVKEENDRFLAGLLRLGTGAVVLDLVIGRFSQAAGAILQAQVAADKLEASLKFGGGAAVSAEIEYLIATSRELGINFSSVSEQYGRLAASARGTALAGQQTREIFEAVSQATTVMGLRAEEAEGAFRAIVQIMSKGQVQAEELRGQLGERLPGAFQISARAMGVTTAELSKLLETGQVLSTDFLPKFAAQLKKELAGSVPEASRSAQSEINRLSTEWTLFKRNLADGAVGDVLVGTVRGAASSFRLFNNVVEQGAEKNQGFAATLFDLVRAFGPFGDVTLAAAGNVEKLAGERQRILDLENKIAGLPPQTALYHGYVNELAVLKENLRIRSLIVNADPDGSYERLEARRRGQVESRGLIPEVFSDAKPLADVRKFVTLRNDVVAKGNQELLDLEKSYVNQFNRLGVAGGNAEQVLRNARASADAKVQAQLVDLETRRAALMRQNTEELRKFDAAGQPRGAAAAANRLLDGEQVALERGFRLQAEARRDLYDEIESLRRRDLLSETDYVRQRAALDTQQLADELASIEARLEIARRQKNNSAEVERLQGDAGVKRVTLANLAAKAERDVLEIQEKAAREEKKRFDDAVQERGKAVQAIREENEGREFEISLIGLTEEAARALAVQRELDIAARLEEQAAIYGQADATRAFANELQAEAEARRRRASLLNTEGERRATQKLVDDQAREYERLYDEISRGVTDAIFNGGEGGVGKLRDLFRNIAFRVFIEPVVRQGFNTIASSLGFGVPQSQQQSGFSGGGGLFGGFPGGGGFGGGSGLVGLANSFSFSSLGQSAGLSLSAAASPTGYAILTEAGAAAGAAAGTGILGAIGSALPYVGIALAVASLFGSKGGPKVDSGFGPGVARPGDPTFAKAASDSIEASYNQIAQQLGIAARNLEVGIFTSRDPEGDSLTQLQVTSLIDGVLSYVRRPAGDFEDVGRSDADLQAAIATESRIVLLEALRQSDLAAEYKRFFEGIDAAALDDAGFQNLINTVAGLKQLRDFFSGATGQFSALTNLDADSLTKFVNALGGLQNLPGLLDSFATNFLPEYERQARLADTIAQALGKVNIALPTTREEFRALVEAQLALGDAGLPALAALLNVNAAFAELVPVTEAAAQSVGQLLNQAQDLTDYIRQLRGGSLSPLSPEAQFFEQRAQFEQTLAAAQGGDASAIGNLRDRAGGFLEAAQSYFGGTQGYADIFNQVTSGLSGVAASLGAVQQPGAPFNPDASLNPIEAARAQTIRDWYNAIGSTADAEGLAFWRQQIADLGLSQAQSNFYTAAAPFTVRRWYDLIGSTPDPEGFEYWINQIATLGQQQAKNNFRSSAMELLGSIPAFANGGIASGLSLVGERGPELVNFAQPSRVFSNAESSAMFGMAGRDMGQVIQRLDRQIEVQTATLRAMSYGMEQANRKTDALIARMDALERTQRAAQIDMEARA